ncbi:serum amyloid A isoform X2 [Takifugu flavidus]|uniref:serum amyloid A isoform X2 n=1 Tax=Takifugu flavidus TaxID=433684 RepID=UPI0025447804|nr:serum amyloid A isoform X2 [Takifugu flavidus]
MLGTGNPSRCFADSSGSSLYGRNSKYIRKSNSPQKGTQQRAPTIKTAQKEKIEIDSSNLSKMSMSAKMKMLLAVIALALLVEANAQSGGFMKQFAQGSADMLRAYRDMREANWKGADKYFHARGNSDAAARGAGGRVAAAVISNTWEGIQRARGRHAEDSEADQRANRWGRNGGDPNHFRPKGLPSKY